MRVRLHLSNNIMTLPEVNRNGAELSPLDHNSIRSSRYGRIAVSMSCFIGVCCSHDDGTAMLCRCRTVPSLLRYYLSEFPCRRWTSAVYQRPATRVDFRSPHTGSSLLITVNFNSFSSLQISRDLLLDTTFMKQPCAFAKCLQWDRFYQANDVNDMCFSVCFEPVT